jgi:2-amino-4-hydroxy-6-hydroxymethyldihydropteridine diphosphokinase
LNKVVILLGSNVGYRKSRLCKAIKAIESEIGVIYLKSKVYVTKAWGNQNQNDFFNQVIEVKSNFNAPLILQKLLNIEVKMGRIRTEKWAARTIDLDILFYNNEIIKSDSLIIPHPQLHLRRFTLVPLVEILPNRIHPQLQLTCSQLLSNCLDTLEVHSLD